MTDADRLAQAVRAKRYGRQYLCRCPAHDDGEPSLTFWQGNTTIRVKCWTGCDPVSVIKALVANGAWPLDGTDPRTRRARLAPVPACQPVEDDAADRQRRLALTIWEDALPALNTPVEAYLEWQRGLFLCGLSAAERVDLLTEVIRFHPACPHGAERVPAMISLMRSIPSNAPRAIHRTFLDSRCRKLGKAMMLGPSGGAAIKLQPKGPDLVVCEGVETGIGCILLGDHPVWALGCAGAIARLEPKALPGVRRLIVRADHDQSGTGQKAARQAVLRWIAEGRAAVASVPTRLGEDYADVAAEGVR